MCSHASSKLLMRTTPLSTASVSVSVVSWYTTPGQSMRKMRLVRFTYCHTLVSPGMGAVTHTFLVRSAFMTELFPTLGYPTNPTLMFCLSMRSRENCRSRLSSAPLPKGLVTEAWNASVGYSRLRVCSQRLVTHAGTRSTLLRSRITCLCRFMASRLRCCSRCRQRVPMGSRASSTCTMTSEESTTLYSSPQMRLDCPFSNRLPLTSLRTPSSFSRTRSRSWMAPASVPSE
mmetsp:Transcript_258/g.584  ORF Transcript_258/g.584 Transcript_258/m.584 type:complete len:231 (-) Transcript_258:554-1246(-)